MKFSINSREFEKLLAKVLPALPTRTPIDALNSFKFECSGNQLVITGSDNAVFIRASYTLDTELDFEFLVDGKFIYESIRVLDDTLIHFDILDGATVLRMTTDSGQYSMNINSTAEYPAFPQFADSHFQLSLKADTFKKAVEITSFAADSDSAVRPALNGVLFECHEQGINFVATDGHKLVKYSLFTESFDTNRRIIVPKAALEAMVKIISTEDITISFSERHLNLVTGSVEMIGRLVEANYPEYKNVIPVDNENKLVIDKKSLVSALRRAQVYTTQNFEQVLLDIDTHVVTVKTDNADKGHISNEELPCDYSGKPMKIAFNAHWLYAVVSRFDGNSMLMKIGLPIRACIIERLEKNPENELVMLIMPLRLNS